MNKKMISATIFFGIAILLLFRYIIINTGTTPHSYRMARMRNVGLALLQYKSNYGVFPPSCIENYERDITHSWRAQIIHELGSPGYKQSFYSVYSFSEPWEKQMDIPIVEQTASLFNTKDSASESTDSSIFMVYGKECILSKYDYSDSESIRDSPENTILLIEIPYSDIPWLQPYDVDSKVIKEKGWDAFRNSKNSHFKSFCVFFADGSVEKLPTDLEPSLLYALLTKDGAEEIEIDWYSSPLKVKYHN
jgi:hypothetical protein